LEYVRSAEVIEVIVSHYHLATGVAGSEKVDDAGRGSSADVDAGCVEVVHCCVGLPDEIENEGIEHLNIIKVSIYDILN
jgi:hypothetical protein